MSKRGRLVCSRKGIHFRLTELGDTKQLMSEKWDARVVQITVEKLTGKIMS